MGCGCLHGDIGLDSCRQLRQCHSICPALAVLNLCQLLPEPSPSRPGSDRSIIWFGEVWDLLSLPTSFPRLSTCPAAGLCQPKTFSGEEEQQLVLSKASHPIKEKSASNAYVLLLLMGAQGRGGATSPSLGCADLKKFLKKGN